MSKKTTVKPVVDKRKSFEIKKNNSAELSPKIINTSILSNNTSPFKTDTNNTDSENSFLFDLNYIEKIINEHALNLLKKYKLKKLGYMFANLTDFSILKWLKNEP